MNTGFLRLYIYTFRYFEKEKQKINSLKISGFDVISKVQRAPHIQEWLLCKSDEMMFFACWQSDAPFAQCCLRSYIVFDSDIYPVGKLWKNTATSATSRNITLAKVKISLAKQI